MLIDKNIKMEKEEVFQNLRQIIGIIKGSYELLPPGYTRDDLIGTRIPGGPKLTFRGRPARESIMPANG